MEATYPATGRLSLHDSSSGKRESARSPPRVGTFVNASREHRRLSELDKLLLRSGGDLGVALQHVGVLVGRSAHRDLGPRILDRLGATV